MQCSTQQKEGKKVPPRALSDDSHRALDHGSLPCQKRRSSAMLRFRPFALLLASRRHQPTLKSASGRQRFFIADQIVNGIDGSDRTKGGSLRQAPRGDEKVALACRRKIHSDSGAIMTVHRSPSAGLWVNSWNPVGLLGDRTCLHILRLIFNAALRVCCRAAAARWL